MFVVFNMTKIQVRKQFTTSQKKNKYSLWLFSIWRRYKFESNSQLQGIVGRFDTRCFQYDEDTSSKAIHNVFTIASSVNLVVFNMTKIQVRKQFTTPCKNHYTPTSLFSIWRRYKFESNSQPIPKALIKWDSCFQYDEDTSSKAIHNVNYACVTRRLVVFNMTKIQVRKQFTTYLIFICF